MCPRAGSEPFRDEQISLYRNHGQRVVEAPPSHQGQGDMRVTSPLNPSVDRFVEGKHLKKPGLPATKLARKIDGYNHKIHKELLDPKFGPEKIGTHLAINGVAANYTPAEMTKALNLYLNHPSRRREPSVFKSVDLFGVGPGGKSVQHHFDAKALQSKRPTAVTSLGQAALSAKSSSTSPASKVKPVPNVNKSNFYKNKYLCY